MVLNKLKSSWHFSLKILFLENADSLLKNKELKAKIKNELKDKADSVCHLRLAVLLLFLELTVSYMITPWTSAPAFAALLASAMAFQTQLKCRTQTKTSLFTPVLFPTESCITASPFVSTSLKAYVIMVVKWKW